MFRSSFARALIVALLIGGFATAANAAAPEGPHLTFENQQWGSTHRSVRSGLEAAGFRYFASEPGPIDVSDLDDYYRGVLNGAGVTVACVYTPDDELVFVRVIFDANADVSKVDDTLQNEFGKAVSCNADNTACRWTHGSESLAYAAKGDPYAGQDQASLEFTAGGFLAEKYVQQVNNRTNNQDLRDNGP
jgi:hypothetical protein